MRSRNSLKVSIRSGAEPLMNRRMSAAGVAGQAGLGEQPHIQRRHTHEHRRVRQARNHRLRIEPGEPDHPAAVDQRAMGCDKEPVDVEDRQRVDQHVAACRR